MTTFESSIRQIPFPQQNVYDKLSDLNNLQKLKERYELMKDNMPEEAPKPGQRDILYRNNGDGSFTDVIRESVPHTPWFSMGAD